METVNIRTATVEDASRLLEIYGYYVENTAISLEYETPSLEVFQGRIEKTLKKYPYLVAEQEGKIIGYAYAGPFHERAAFYMSAEVSIYIDKDARKGGVGRKLYEELEAQLKEIGILNIYASIAYADEDDAYLNKNSPQFHAHMGFVEVARFHKCGKKFGRWYDLMWMEKMLGEHKAEF